MRAQGTDPTDRGFNIDSTRSGGKGTIDAEPVTEGEMDAEPDDDSIAQESERVRLAASETLRICAEDRASKHR